MDKQQEGKADRRNEKQSMRKLWSVALVFFVTFCCCTLFFFVIYRYNGFADFFKSVSKSLEPVIIGLVIAYLLNPVMKWIEGGVLKLSEKRIKSEEKRKSFSRGVGIAVSLTLLVSVVVVLIAAVAPSVGTSVTELATSMSGRVETLTGMINDVAESDSVFADVAQEVLTNLTDFFENWITSVLLPQIQKYFTSITSGVISGAKFLLNIIVGLIISVYVMASQEKFAGQGKKLVYAIFKPVRANAILRTVRKSNEIFGGFVGGKLLDSAIIGLIAYVVLWIMKMPDPVLIAVIVGVTNIIPFFGPFIGAIPSFLLIVLQSPIQGLYFVIFIIVLQQIDGNIIGPKILGNSTGLSPFWVVFAILLFGGLWGFLGMLLGVPLMAVIHYIVWEVVEDILAMRGVPEDIDYVRLSYLDKETKNPEYQSADKKTRQKSEKLKALEKELKPKGKKERIKKD